MAADLLPNEVNERMNKAGAYANSNLVNWTKAQAAIPWLQFEWRSPSTEGYNNDRVKAAIDKNGYCLVEVDGTRIGGTKHWVLYKGNGLMIDPWTGVEKSTSYYPALGYAIINRVGNPPADGNMYKGLDLTNVDSMKVCVDDHMRIVNGELVEKSRLDEYTVKVAEQQKTINDLTIERDNANLARDRANSAMDDFRKENNVFIADLAGIYACRQEKPEILAEAKKSITFEDLSQKLQDTLNVERAEYAQNLKDMKIEMDNLKDQLDKANKKLADLEANKPTNVITSEQVTSVIDRFISWLKGRSKWPQN